MKVFISWSGKTSVELAKIIRDWLPSVIQAVKPYFSKDDIEKGTRANTMLAQELEGSGVGIICLTRENLEAPWIMFEAGSLSKSLDKSRVCPILFGDLGTTDLKGPLANFQAAKFNEEEMRTVIATINSQLGDSALGPKTLETVFDKWWPELDQKVKEVLSRASEDTGEKIRGDRELLEEILTLTRLIPDLGRAFPISRLSTITLEESNPMITMAKILLSVKDANDVQVLLTECGYDEITATKILKMAQLQKLWKSTPPKDKSDEIKS